MSVRSIIDVEVNDNAFVKFYQSFKQYKADVEGMKGKWDAATASIKGGGAAVEGASSATEDAAKSIGKLAQAGELLGGAFAAVAAAVAAVGAVSIEAAAKIAQARRDSIGLGMTIGQHNALNANFSNYTNPGAFMENVSNAQADLSQLGKFSAMGISPDVVESSNPAELSIMVARQARALYQMHPQLTGQLQFMRSHGIDNFMPLDSFRNFGAMTAGDETQWEKDVRADSKAMNINDPDAKTAANAHRGLTRDLGRGEVLAANALALPIKGLGIAARAASDAQDGITSGDATKAVTEAAKNFAHAVRTDLGEAFRDTKKVAQEAAAATVKFADGTKRVVVSLVQALALYEDVRADAYLDSNGLVTTGMGHHDKNTRLGQHLTGAQIAALAKEDINKRTPWLERQGSWVDHIGKARRDALIDINFNGYSKALQTRVLDDAKRGDWHGAATDLQAHMKGKQYDHKRMADIMYWLETNQESVSLESFNFHGGNKRLSKLGSQGPINVKVNVTAPAGMNAVVAANGAGNVN